MPARARCTERQIRLVLKDEPLERLAGLDITHVERTQPAVPRPSVNRPHGFPLLTERTQRTVLGNREE